jgi:phosphatidylinositol alpha 1,6-mannosyltransferase
VTGAGIPRIAFFADSFHEVNGVALTCRQFDCFAGRHQHPFFSVHTGPATKVIIDGQHRTRELALSRFSFHVERDLSFDLAFWRHLPALRKALRTFQPDLIHVTGPSHLGMLGAILSRQLNVPLAASWHTNIHEYAELRLERKLTGLSRERRIAVSQWAGRQTLKLSLRFYQLARLLFAPNPELVQMLALQTGRPAHLMERGIDTHRFSPEKRTRGRGMNDGTFVIGFVGRLSPEKNVRLLAQIEQRLIDTGIRDCRFLIVGDGSERSWLAANLRQSDFTGVLTGDALAQAYANMDAFVFPSETDTFGNVVLEAMASGVPALVGKGGGPKYLVRAGSTGLVAETPDEFAQALMDLRSHPALRERMACQARTAALQRSWDSVFENVYSHYSEILKENPSTTGNTNAAMVPAR